MSKHKDFGRIKLLALDMDGVLTDGGIYVGSMGEQLRRFHAHDGQGIKYLQEAGVVVGLITGSRESALIKVRMKMLGIKSKWTSIGTKNKLEKLESWIENLEITMEEVAYIGDDVPDIELMQKVGISACPSDALPSVQEVADIVLTKAGGQGCVRELIERILRTKSS